MIKKFFMWIKFKFIKPDEVGQILVGQGNKWKLVDANHPKNNRDVIVNNTRPF